MKLLQLANDHGVTMGSRYNGRAFGFTTDEEAAELLLKNGARCSPCYNGTGTRGWEVSFAPDADAERVEDLQATRETCG